jgi:hypothetical protein
MVGQRYLLLVILLAVGTGVRESTLLMLPALWLHALVWRSWRETGWALLISVTTLAAAAAHRGLFADLPPYIWVPSGQRFLNNITRPESWLTVTLTLAPLLLGLGLGRSAPPAPRTLRALAVAVGLPALALLLYATVAAYMSGRFCWPLYIALGPWAAWRLAHSGLGRVFGRVAGPVGPLATKG